MAKQFRESDFPWFPHEDDSPVTSREVNDLALYALQIRGQEDFYIGVVPDDPLRTDYWRFPLGNEWYVFYIANAQRAYPDVSIGIVSGVGKAMDEGEHRGKRLFRHEEYNLSNRAFFARKALYKIAVGEPMYMLEEEPVLPQTPPGADAPRRERAHVTRNQQKAFNDLKHQFYDSTFTRSKLQKLCQALRFGVGPAIVRHTVNDQERRS